MRDARPIFFLFCYNLIIIFSFVCVSIIKKKFSSAWLCSPPMSKSIISTVVNIEANNNHMVGFWIFHKFFLFSQIDEFSKGEKPFISIVTMRIFRVFALEKTNKWRKTIIFSIWIFGENNFFFRKLWMFSMFGAICIP